MTNPTPLSPAAQAVLDAYNREARPEPHHQCEAIAAVLRALVETCSFEHFNNFNTVLIFAEDVLAIATELENHP